MIHHRADPDHTPNFLRGFDKRPRVELYGSASDLHQLTNLAEDPEYTDTSCELRNQLLAELERQRDPRLCESPCRVRTRFVDRSVRRAYRAGPVTWPAGGLR